MPAYRTQHNQGGLVLTSLRPLLLLQGQSGRTKADSTLVGSRHWSSQVLRIRLPWVSLWFQAVATHSVAKFLKCDLSVTCVGHR